MRQSFRAAVSMLAVGFATALGMTAAEATSCPNPRQMDGFKTCADVAKAEQEGECGILHDRPAAGETELRRLHASVPQDQADLLRLQAGDLFQRSCSPSAGEDLRRRIARSPT